MPLSAGTMLRPYEIQAPAGIGGREKYTKPGDTRWDRTVAIKALPSELAASPELRQRLEREARSITFESFFRLPQHYRQKTQSGHWICPRNVSDSVQYETGESNPGQVSADRTLCGVGQQ